MGQKSSLVSGNWVGEIFFITYPPTQSNVYQNIYFLFKKHTHANKKQQKPKKKQKQKETEEKKKENFVIVNSICGKSNMIQYRLRIHCVLLTFWISPGCSYEFNIVYVQWEIKNQRNEMNS